MIALYVLIGVDIAMIISLICAKREVIFCNKNSTDILKCCEKIIAHDEKVIKFNEELIELLNKKGGN